jgi:hypothetical protein
MVTPARVGILGGGLAGCCTALALAQRGIQVDLFEGSSQLLQGASLHNEGKLHLGYVYAADPDSQTHALLALGSLSFLSILESLTGTPCELFTRSRPFMYAIAADSLLDTETVSRHFGAVDKAISAIYRERPELKELKAIAPVVPLSTQQLGEHFSPDAVVAGFQTGEYSLDTAQVAQLVGACVRAHPNILVRTRTSVVGAERTVGGNYAISSRSGDEHAVRKYPFIVNCLWNDRIKIDACVGITPTRPWLMRYKAAITLRRHPEDQLLRRLPSTTLVLGPYGDLVNHGNGKVYLSWYPICKLGETPTSNCDPLYETASSINFDLLVHESLAALSRYVPCLEKLRAGNDCVEVGGGVIFAWGSSDITDIDSGLHQRYRIGPSVHDNWISVDTGKYCMAPFFGLQTADLVVDYLQ